MLPSLLQLLNRKNAARAVVCCALLAGSQAAHAQVTRGFDRTAPATASAVELSRQPDYWTMEVQMKPVRLVWINEVNPVNGETTKTQIWYLAWRSIVRPVTPQETPDSLPVNTLDPLPGPLKFIPQMTLVTYDDPATEVPKQIIQDEILPAAISQLRQVERNTYLDMVNVVQDLPEATPADAEDQKWIYGATTFKGVNPDTRFFKIVLGGFTNGYEVRADAGSEPQTWRKVIVQRFHRPGDRFDPNNSEFLYSGAPEWVYQPDPASTKTVSATE